MSRVPERNQKRDKDLIKDYESQKYSTAQLVGKYKVSMTRIYQILNYHGIARLGKVRSNDGKNSK